MNTTQKVRNIPLVLAVFFIAAGLAIGPVANVTAAYTDAGGYEEEVFLPGINIFVNQSETAVQPGGNAAQIGWKIVNYWYFPDSYSEEDFTILDDSVELRFGLFGKDTSNQRSSFNVKAGGEDVSETGNTEFTERFVAPVIQPEEADVLMENDVGNDVPVTYDYLNDIGDLDDMTYNYTVPENRITDGIVYEAGDGKSILDYAKAISEADSETFYNLVNSSIVGFEFENTLDTHDGLVWQFKSDDQNALDLNGFSIKGATTWLKSKVDKVKSGITGSSTYKAIDQNVFKPIKNAGTSLAAIPKKAATFFTKTIPDGLKNAFTGVKSVVSKVFKSVGGFLPIILIAGALVLVFVLRRN